VVFLLLSLISWTHAEKSDALVTLAETEIEARESEEAELADVQLLQVSHASPHPEVDRDPHVEDSAADEDEVPPPRYNASKMFKDAQELWRNSTLLQESHAYPHPEVDGDPHDEDSAADEDEVSPPRNNVSKTSKDAQELWRNSTLLHVDSETNLKGMHALTFSYPDGSQSTNNYCPSSERYTLAGGTKITAEVCRMLSCTDIFYGGSCGPYFYTSAAPGSPESLGVCKCCKGHDPTVYKSSLGNKMYQC